MYKNAVRNEHSDQPNYVHNEHPGENMDIVVACMTGTMVEHRLRRLDSIKPDAYVKRLALSGFCRVRRSTD